MPSLRPAHYIVLALSLIDSFKVFDMIYAMTYGGPGTATQVMGTWMYANVFQYYQAGYGTAIAVVITVVAIAVSIPYVLSQTREHPHDRDRSGRVAGRGARLAARQDRADRRPRARAASR